MPIATVAYRPQAALVDCFICGDPDDLAADNEKYG